MKLIDPYTGKEIAAITTDHGLTMDEAIQMLDEAHGDVNVFDMLHNMRENSDLTYAHSINVALICHVIAEWIGMTKGDITLAFTCGILHDIGKLRMPEELINKTDKLTSLGDFLPTPAYCSEKIYLYMANKLEYCGQDLDDDEFLSVEKYPLDVLHEMVLKNEINDSKTVIAILKAKAMLK